MNNSIPDFGHILELTAKTDYNALTLHMLEFVNALSCIREVALYEVFRNTTPHASRESDYIYRRFNRDLAAPRATELMPGLDLCMSRNDVTEFIDESQLHNLIIPVRSKSGPFRLFCIRANALNETSRTYLTNMLQLYQNQVHLLDDKERDSLTGLLNRQTLGAHLQALSARVHETQQQAWLAILDIDHFKRVNDTYGHLYGDEVLLHFSQMMERSFRYTDHLFRYGGEEFVVLLANTNAENALGTLERFRVNIAKHIFPIDSQVTVSIGYTEVRQGVLPTTLFDQADQSLYEAKSTGRNRIIFFDNLETLPNASDRGSELF